MLKIIDKVLIVVFVFILAGVFSCVIYFSISVRRQEEKKQAEHTAVVIDKLLSDAAVKTIGLASDIAELSRSHISPPYRLNDFTILKQGFLDNKIDFIEVNLPEMKIKVFKASQGKEFSILTRGNPASWGGTAAGLYKIEAGAKEVYSPAASAYMPNALKFYGKYYIHGEPYYPTGEKLISSVSGGCLRLRDKDAKELYELSEIGMPVLVIDKENDYYSYPRQVKTLFPAVTAENYLVADLGSGFVFAEKNSTEQRPIASLTKLMTSLVISENIDLDRFITIRDWMLNGYGSAEKLEDGQSLSVVELLYLMLVESSNNAAEVITYFLDRARTVELMNQKTRAILMASTGFTGPSGYDPGNVSTAQDLFYLLRYILNVRYSLFKITRSEIVPSFSRISFNVGELWNKNVFSQDSTFVGGKTGFIKESDYNGLFVFRFKTEDNQDRNVAIILLGSKHQDSLKSDTQKIYIWLAKNYFDYEKTVL